LPFHFGAHGCGTLADVDQSVAVAPGADIETPAIVVQAQNQVSALAIQFDFHAAGGGMPRDIVDSFFEDQKDLPPDISSAPRAWELQ
jgi:hypothetical protein